MDQRSAELGHRYIRFCGKHPVQQNRLVRSSGHDVEQGIAGAAAGGNGNLALAKVNALGLLRMQQQAGRAGGASRPMTVSAIYIQVSARTGFEIAVRGIVPTLRGACAGSGAPISSPTFCQCAS
jgi:hypothetical protein